MGSTGATPSAGEILGSCRTGGSIRIHYGIILVIFLLLTLLLTYVGGIFLMVLSCHGGDRDCQTTW